MFYSTFPLSAKGSEIADPMGKMVLAKSYCQWVMLMVSEIKAQLSK
jgi:hypothetical protein